MTIKRSGLGRNLSALLSTSANANTNITSTYKSDLHKLSLDKIQPGKYQPRGEFDDLLLAELAASIKQQGLLQPIIVRELDLPNSYEILAGERRWRACQLAELKEIPVIIKQVDDQTAMAIALVENLQREDLNALDQARAMERLVLEFGLTHQQIAELLHKSRTAVSNFLRLLTLSPSVKRLLENADIDMGHARALLPLQEQQQNQIAELIIAKELSVRETEKIVERIKKEKSLKKSVLPSDINIYVPIIENLSQRFQTKIALKPAKNGNGTLVFHYKNPKKLELILALLNTESLLVE